MFFARFFQIYLVISKKSRTFAPAFEGRTLESIGMWRSPVAQRSGGPEVASSNLVIPTKSPQGLFFLYRSKSNAKVLLFFEIRNSLDKNNHFVAERRVETVLPQGKTAEALCKKTA